MSAVIASEKRALIVGVMRLWSGIGGIRMAENKMSQVAEMFGKKLNEPFRVKVRKMEEPFEAMFTESGIVVTYDNWPSALLLQLLLIDEAVIVDD
jgi:hypothetical protein